ncbi:MAG: hypothetical protein HY329_03975 [Chloroflexi bacterium]|nr:hypothetical protein [Chloroflexota bacterium]
MKPRPATTFVCPSCGTDERNRYEYRFHRNGVERSCSGCGRCLHVERTDPLRLGNVAKILQPFGRSRLVEKGNPNDDLTKRPPDSSHDCARCAGRARCPVEQLLLTMRVDEIRQPLAIGEGRAA